MASPSAPARPKPRIGRPRLFEEVCARIRADIISGVLAPGDKLPPERDLSASLGISRHVLREALRSLENAGLVRLTKGASGGATILDGRTAVARSFQDGVDLGHVTIDELTEARVQFESLVVALACARATEADFAALEADIERVDALTRSGEVKARTEYVTHFYEILASATGNRALVIVSQSLAGIVARIVERVKPDPLYDLADMRRTFLKHLRRRQARKASAVLEAHFETLRRHILAAEAALESRALTPPASSERAAATLRRANG
jgi:DNA-binding FadR family transcriptional regulator